MAIRVILNEPERNFPVHSCSILATPGITHKIGSIPAGAIIVVKTSKEELNAEAANEFIAGKLEIKKGDPILISKRFMLDANQMPVEYNIGYYRADSFTYSIECDR